MHFEGKLDTDFNPDFDMNFNMNFNINTMAADIVFSEMDSGVILLNADQEIVRVNPAAAAMFPQLAQGGSGMNIQELTGFPMELFHTGIGMEFSMGDQVFEGRVKPIADQGQKLHGYVVMFLDMTETFQHMDELVEMREKAESANRTKNEFIMNLSHEIRTPMNAIIGLSNLIMEESRGKKVYEFARDIKSSSQNLLGIISDILDLSKADSGKMRLVEQEYTLPSLLDDMVAATKAAAFERGLEFRYQCDSEIPCKLKGDVRRIRQIVNNILSNAIKFTEKGSVSLSVSYEQQDEDQIALVFWVADTGIGIKEEHLEYIFENFQQIDTGIRRKAGGTGLGLSIARRLAQLMGGMVTVDSIFGAGSVFAVTIPQKVVDGRTLDEMKAEEPQKERQMFTAPEYRILVVDDNLINRKVVEGILKSYGCQVSEAESGAEAIRLVKEQAFDLIFMDHMMPEMDGMEAAGIIRKDCGENGRSAVIIALTANTVDGLREMFLKNGFQGFMTKPIDSQQLNDLLSEWVPEDKKTFGEAIEQHTVSFQDMDGLFINGVDVQKALERHHGTLDDYLELLSLFCLDGERKRPYLNELCQKEDWTNYRIEVHGLKSAAANLGAMELSEQARLLEMAAQEGDHGYIREHHSGLDQAYQTLLEEITHVLEKRNPSGEDELSGNQRQITPDQLMAMVKEALDLLEHFKPRECAKKVDELLECGIDPEIRKHLENTRGKLKLYEDDEAEDILRAAIKEISDKENHING